MKRKLRLLALLAVCVTGLCFPEWGSKAQTQEKKQTPLSFDSDKLKPSPPVTKERKRTPTTKSPVAKAAPGPAPAAADSETGSAAAPGACYTNVLLVMDDLRQAVVNLYNYPPNSSIPVTVTQTEAGIIGYAATSAGPFNPTINININTDGAGNGQSVPFWIEGLQVGVTTSYGVTPYGTTTTNDIYVWPQCNCPPIPVVP